MLFGSGIGPINHIIHRAELEAIEDEAERAERHRLRTEELKTYHTALATAERFHVDDVIDPAETRAILANTLAALPAPAPGRGRKRTVDPW